MKPNEFPWGKVVKVHTIGTHTIGTHTIGTHTITEYIVGKAWHNAGGTEFGVCNNSFDTLDRALLYSICHKAGDTEAMPYIEKMLGGLE